MAWFSKSKSNKDSELFLSEFPSWTAIHSAKLVAELQAEDNNTGWSELLKDDAIKSKLISCFIGTHIVYLSLSAEGAIIEALFGEKILEKSLSTLPEKAKAFVILTLTLFKNKPPINEDKLLSSLTSFYGVKIDPIDAYVAFAIEQDVRPAKEFSGLIGGLLPIVNRLQIEQLDWLKEMADRWALNK